MLLNKQQIPQAKHIELYFYEKKKQNSKWKLPFLVKKGDIRISKDPPEKIQHARKLDSFFYSFPTSLTTDFDFIFGADLINY